MSPTLKSHLEFYKSQHRTKGCKLTHMVGVPLIFFSVPTLLINWRLGLKFFAAGWGCQFIGHFLFEKNRPVLFSQSNALMTAAAAAIFVCDGWARLLTGQPLSDEELDDDCDQAESAPEAEGDTVPSAVIELQKRVFRRRQAL